MDSWPKSFLLTGMSQIGPRNKDKVKKLCLEQYSRVDNYDVVHSKNEYSIKKAVIPKINFKGNHRLKMIIRPNFRLITNIRLKRIFGIN